ncbi:MAG TPA: ABC transporter ATP-binding protein [Isosphaeraceae bacterium]|nr:ABC transporter ATP-binding protein [Isosphaeraceae bacterium]
MARVELRGMSKVYPNGVEAVSGIDATVADGTWFVVVGPSGSGKSTLLRLVAGLETPTAGSLWIGGERSDGLPPRDRDVAMVFQNPALYPHLTVFENLAFGLRARRLAGSEIRARVAEVAGPLGLAGLLDRRPRTLSGGQRQRVALGRALARRARVLLLDEPLSSLDAPLRASLRATLIDWHRRLGTTTIHVTHDQAEALAMSDRVAVMHRGRIVQAGTAREIYHHPAHRFVAEFVGNPPLSLIPCQVEADGPALRIRPEGMAGETAWTLPSEAVGASTLRGLGPGRVELGLRAEHVAVAEPRGARAEPAQVLHRTEVRRLEPLGHETIATLALGPHLVSTRLPPASGLCVGDGVTVTLDLARAVWFDPATGNALRPEPTG